MTTIKDYLRQKLLDHLEGTDEGLSQLELMCFCYGYRCAHGKLLYFSVYERQLKQLEKFSQVNILLRNVIEEASAEFDKRKQSFDDAEVRAAKRAKKLEKFELKEPQKDVQIEPAKTRVIPGRPPTIRSPLDFNKLLETDILPRHPALLDRVDSRGKNSPYQQILDRVNPRLLDGFSSIQPSASEVNPFKAMQRQAAGLLAGIDVGYDPLDEGTPPRYEEIPEVRGPSEYALLQKELIDKLRRYPKVVWQKISIERDFYDNEQIQRRVQVARQSTKRALNSLVNDGIVIVDGHRTAALFQKSIE